MIDGIWAPHVKHARWEEEEGEVDVAADILSVSKGPMSYLLGDIELDYPKFLLC